jgi:broad specificity phosphatase PhoE
MHSPALLVSSEEPKAIETAQIVGERLRIETRTAPDLDEHRRPFVDRPEEFERLMQRFFAEPDQRVFGDESANEALARFAAAVDAAVGAQGAGNPAIVAHGTVISLYAAPLFGVGAGALWQRLQMPSFVVVDTEARRGLRIVDEVE